MQLLNRVRPRTGRSTTTRRRVGTTFTLVVAFLTAMSGLAYGDQVVNTIDTTIDPALEQVTIPAGGSIGVGFYILGTTGGGDAPGCNATGSDPAFMTIDAPSGVIVTYPDANAANLSNSALRFAGCGSANVRTATLSANVAGTYTIDTFVLSGGKAGSLWNTSPAAFTLQVNPSDTTPPQASPAASPPANAHGWNNSDVTVAWNWADNAGGSGIDPSSCAISSTSSGEGTIVLTATCSDRAGNTGNASYTVMVDKTAPTASAAATPGPNANGWNNTNVTVSFSGTDALSGIDTCSAPVVLSNEGPGQQASGSCTDKAGNSASATASGIAIDKTAPWLSPSVSPNPVVLNGSATASPNAGDSLSGVDSASCDPVETGSVGAKTVSCTATDEAGNTATTGASYSVVYDFAGFFQPVENPGPGPAYVYNRVKAGSAIPVKFSLKGNQGLSIFSAGYPQSVKVSCNTAGTMDDLTETVTAGNSGLSYDTTLDQYTYVWKTDKAWGGTCRKLTVRLLDGTDHVAFFNFTR